MELYHHCILVQGIFLPTLSDAYSEPSETYKMKLLTEITNHCKLALTIKPQF